MSDSDSPADPDEQRHFDYEEPRFPRLRHPAQVEGRGAPQIDPNEPVYLGRRGGPMLPGNPAPNYVELLSGDGQSYLLHRLIAQVSPQLWNLMTDEGYPIELPEFSGESIQKIMIPVLERRHTVLCSVTNGEPPLQFEDLDPLEIRRVRDYLQVWD